LTVSSLRPRASRSTSAARLCSPARRAAAPQAHHSATVVGGVSGRPSRGLRVQPFLSSLSALESGARYGAAPGASTRREVVCRLGGRDHSRLRSRNRRSASGVVVRGVLGASNYTYAEANQDQQMMSWIGAYVRTFEFLGGCPLLVVPDNTKTGVTAWPSAYLPWKATARVAPGSALAGLRQEGRSDREAAVTDRRGVSHGHVSFHPRTHEKSCGKYLARYTARRPTVRFLPFARFLKQHDRLEFDSLVPVRSPQFGTFVKP
jgi:hypothetical protein